MAKIVVYVTFPNLDEARRVGRQIVQDRLVACVNILPGMQSIYWWDGQIVEDQEIVLIAKTTSDHFEPLRKCIVSMHSYEVPCIVAWPIEHAHAAYLQWISQETEVSVGQAMKSVDGA